MAVVPLGAGDFIAISKLIYRIGAELKKSSKSAPEYQLLLVELESLDRALKWLQSIKPARHELRKLDAIRAVACTCQQPLEAFIAKIEKFEHRLGSFAAPGRSMARATRGLQWSLKYDDEVKSLRAKLAPNVATITILLLTQTADTLANAETDHQNMMQEVHAKLGSQQEALQGVEQASSSIARAQDRLKMGQETLCQIASDQSQTLSHLQCRADELLMRQTVHEERMSQHTEALRTITENETAIEAELKECSTIADSINQNTQEIKSLVPSILERVLELMGIVSAGVRQLQNISSLLSQILSVTTEFSKGMMQTMGNLLQAFCDLQRQIASLERWMPRQIDLPIVRFRDAFNDVRIFPFDLSREWNTFQQLVYTTFSNKQGLHRVNMGQYYITNARSCQRLKPRFWRHAIQPGDELAMTMILDDLRTEEGYCPFKSCGASTANVALINGGKICGQCHRFASITQNEAELKRKERADSSVERSFRSIPDDNDAYEEYLDILIAKQNSLALVHGPHSHQAIEEDIELYHSVEVAEALHAEHASEIIEDELGQPSPLPDEPAPDSTESKNSLLSQIQILVRNLQGKTKAIRTDPNTTVLSIKEELQVTEGIRPEGQKLIFSGKSLRDERTLADYNIRNDSTLHLTSGLTSSIGPVQIDADEYKRRSGVAIGTKITIWIKFLSGEHAKINIKNDKTILRLKGSIEKLTRHPIYNQRLIFAGGLLDDDVQLYRYGIMEGNTVHIVLRLRSKRRTPAALEYRAELDIPPPQDEDLDTDLGVADIASLFQLAT